MDKEEDEKTGDKQSKSLVERTKVEMSFLEWQSSREAAKNQHEIAPKKQLHSKMQQRCQYQQQQQIPMPYMLAPPVAPQGMRINNYQNHGQNSFHSNFNNNIMHRNYSPFCDDESLDGPGFAFRQIPNQCDQLNINLGSGFNGRRVPTQPMHFQGTNRSQQKPQWRKNAATTSNGADKYKKTTTQLKKIPGTVTNNSDGTPVVATTAEVRTSEKPKVPLKYPRIRGMVRPTKPPPIIPTTSEEREEKKKLWRDYRVGMKPFKNRDFANAKRVVQRLAKKERSEWSEIDHQRYDKAIELIAGYKQKLSEKTAAGWVCTTDSSASFADATATESTSKVQIYVRKPIVSTYNVPPPPPPQSGNSNSNITISTPPLSQQQYWP